MIRILIADESGLTGDAMRSILGEQEDIYVVGCVHTEEELYFSLPHSNILLLSVRLGSRSASDIIKDICEAHSGVKTLVVGIHDNPRLILQYIEAGASGYVLRQETMGSLLAKVRAAYNDLALISPAIAAQLMGRLAKLANHPLTVDSGRRANNLAELTPREQEVLGLINNGYTNQEIANKLFITCGTVKNHVHSILEKLEASSRHDAAIIYEMYQNQPSTLTMNQPGALTVA
jgi:DNA-binding NarL/FixJ family response regulator